MCGFNYGIEKTQASQHVFFRLQNASQTTVGVPQYLSCCLINRCPQQGVPKLLQLTMYMLIFIDAIAQIMFNLNLFLTWILCSSFLHRMQVKTTVGVPQYLSLSVLSRCLMKRRPHPGRHNTVMVSRATTRKPPLVRTNVL